MDTTDTADSCFNFDDLEALFNDALTSDESISVQSTNDRIGLVWDDVHTLTTQAIFEQPQTKKD